MFIVVTKTVYNASAEKEVLELAALSLPIAGRQPGLVSATQHVAKDRSHLLTYWVWESEEHHLACMASPDWADFNPRWESLQAEGFIDFELTVYDLLGEATAS